MVIFSPLSIQHYIHLQTEQIGQCLYKQPSLNVNKQQLAEMLKGNVYQTRCSSLLRLLCASLEHQNRP